MSRGYDLLEWKAVNTVTGEIIDIDLLQAKEGGSWNKVFLREFAAMVGLTGSNTAKVLGVLLQLKNNKNEILGTQREIAKKANTSTALVNKTIQALVIGGYLKQIRSGCYLLNPDAIVYGSIGNKVAILKIWSNLDE